MAHLLDPSSLRDEAAYAAALDELEDLMLADPGTPGGRRFDELAVLIEDYEARRDGYDLARMRRRAAARMSAAMRAACQTRPTPESKSGRSARYRTPTLAPSPIGLEFQS